MAAMPLTHWLPDAPCSQQLGALCAAWAALYLGTRHTVLRHRSAAFANRVVSLLHAAVSIPLCVLALRGRRPLSEFGQATRPEEHAALSVSLAYFLYDTLWCALAERDGAATLAHHLLTVAGLAVGWRGRSGTELTLCLLLMEASNPFLHTRSLLREVGAAGSRAALANDLLFAASFFVCRVLLGPVVVYHTLRSAASPALVKWGGAGIQCVSLLWCKRIVEAGARKAARLQGARRGR